MSSTSTEDIKLWLGESPSSENLTARLSHLSSLAKTSELSVPEVKSYSDTVYFNYYILGLSLQFKPINSYQLKNGMEWEELQNDHLVLDSVDIYNVPKAKGSVSIKSKTSYSSFPINPFSVSLVTLEGKTRPESMSIGSDTTGKQFVETMGEPDRKGGGAGPSSGSINIWCEWSKDGVMVEFAGDESRGPQAWEKGKDAIWKVITVFRP